MLNGWEASGQGDDIGFYNKVKYPAYLRPHY